MKKIKKISLNSLLTIVLFILSQTTYSENYSSSPIVSICAIEKDWLTNPSLPTEVTKSAPDGSSNFCDFYQFSSQIYLYLMSEKSPGVRNFQDLSQFPLLERDSNGKPANSCDEKLTGMTLRTSLDKSSLSTTQAGSSSTIYDRLGNIVYYDVRFDKKTCETTASAVEMKKTNLINFPSGTTELKFAWKVLTAAEIRENNHVTQTQKISGNTVILGLLGMHIAVATTDHPEFVWATYEHNNNTPDCIASNVQTNTDWAFSNLSCTASLDSMDAKAIDACKFNQPSSNQTNPKGKPTNICRVHPNGTASGDLKAGENISDISQQNTQLLSLLGQPTTAKSMQVLTNYFNVGAIWVSDITKNTGGIGVPNERGSLRLANTVAETDFQHVNLTSDFSSNCFGCHNYIGTSNTVNNNITSQHLSHIFKDIKIGQGQSVDITASTIIRDNSVASNICNGNPDAIKKSLRLGTCKNAASYLKWDGNWTNSNNSAGSVCSCEKD
jgi:hypothetical protein